MKKTTIYEIFVSATVMLLLDSIYLSSFKKYFNRVFHSIQGSEITIKYSGVVLCYIVLLLVINYFIISRRAPLLDAFILGFVIYAIYETTNYATLDNWPVFMILLDSLWGGILFVLTSLTTYKIVVK